MTFRVEPRPSSLTGSPTFYVVDEKGQQATEFVYLFREDAQEDCDSMNDHGSLNDAEDDRERGE